MGVEDNMPQRRIICTLLRTHYKIRREQVGSTRWEQQRKNSLLLHPTSPPTTTEFDECFVLLKPNTFNKFLLF